MTTVIQIHRMVHRAASWTLWLGLVLAAALHLLAQYRPPIDLSSSISLFDSGELELASFAADKADTARPEPGSPAQFNPQDARLFGLETEPISGGTAVEKWNRAKSEIAQERSTIDQCRANRDCPGDAQRLIDLSAEGATRNGRAKIGLINRAVDLAIRPVSDQTQWGVSDRWSAPFETLRSGRGDCEDYAIVKYLALLEAGISADDVKIVIVKNDFPVENHAMVAVRVDNQWLILDNRTLTLVRDVDLTRATPEFVLDQGGVRRFLSKAPTRPPPGRLNRRALFSGIPNAAYDLNT